MFSHSRYIYINTATLPPTPLHNITRPYPGGCEGRLGVHVPGVGVTSVSEN